MDERTNRSDVRVDPEQKTQCEGCENKQENCQVALSGSEDLKECCFKLGEDLKALKERLKGLLQNHPQITQGFEMTILSNEYEVVDNAATAYRALEDARMRLGKVVQALDGGKSVYPR